MPESAVIGCIAWDEQSGCLCCGAAGGLVKLISLETGGHGKASVSTATLDGHQAEGHRVAHCCWNAQHGKLTTADDSGHIIVWACQQGTWIEEMVNNRQCSVVSAIQWSPDGSRICIAYEDGAVIVGKVDGTRVWGKELELPLQHLAWSPSSRNILLTTRDGDVYLYDSDGNQIGKMQLRCQEHARESHVAAITWHAARREGAAQKALAIAMVNGTLHLMSSHLDHAPCIVDTMLSVSHAAWHPAGNVLAVAGASRVTQSEQNTNVVRFYSSTGTFLHQLRIPRSKVIQGLAWDHRGACLAVATDCTLFVAAVRINHMYVVCGDTLVYAHTARTAHEHSLSFWNTRNGESHHKSTPAVLGLAASDRYVAVATSDGTWAKQSIVLHDSIGSPVDSRAVPFEPSMLAMTADHVVACSAELVYVWRFCTPEGRLVALEAPGALAAATYEFIFHVEEGVPSHMGSIESYVPPSTISATPAVAVAARGSTLLIAHREGAAGSMISKLPLPDLQHREVMHVPVVVQQMRCNCDASRLAIIDAQNRLLVLALNERDDAAGTPYTQLHDVVQDVWDVCWADDDAAGLALMEKAKLTVMQGAAAEPPTATGAFLASFRDLEATLVDVDALMTAPQSPSAELVSVTAAQSLATTQERLAEGLDAAFEYVERMPHRRLWRLLSARALQDRNFEAAIKAKVLEDDYGAVQFIKQVERLGDARKQAAEICAFHGDYDGAQAAYVHMGRPDLAVQLFMRLGHWQRVESLLKDAQQAPDALAAGQLGGGTGAALHMDDRLLAEVHCHIGQAYMDRRKWRKASRYFVLSKATARLAECLLHMGDVASLRELQRHLPESDAVHKQLAASYESLGLCDEAVESYLKAGMVQRAVDCCCRLSQWARAVELAQEHGMQLDNLLEGRAAQLRAAGRAADEVTLFKKAAQHHRSAQLLVDLAKRALAERAAPLQVKKLYVLAAFEVEKARERNEAQLTHAHGLTTLGGGFAAGRTMATAGTRAQATLQGLVTRDAAAVRGQESMDRAWRGAEAQHFWLLAHRQLYDGHFRAGLRTALNLRRYADTLPALGVYSLLALLAYCAGYYGQCSRALSRLERMPECTPEQRDAFAELASSIFIKHTPVDPDEMTEARSVQDLGARGDMLAGISSEKDSLCVASGRVIRRQEDGTFAQRTLRCRTCRHHMIASELPPPPKAPAAATCPLCHVALPEEWVDRT